MELFVKSIAVAPMLNWTDRHFRYLAHLLAPSTVLYTEMITTGALLHGDAERFLAHDPSEDPLVLQLGGSDPHALAQCARMAQDQTYQAVNLNVGCPSDRVQSGQFGACLLLKPDLVADGVRAMREAVTLPITVKTRIGVDKGDQRAQVYPFIDKVAAAGCRTFIIHARQAWLKGLSPKENRDVPPLDYPFVYHIKKDFPGLEIIINGGINDCASIQTHFQAVDGVMLGRKVCEEPYFLVQLQQLLQPEWIVPSRYDVAQKYMQYMQRQINNGARLMEVARHLLNLFHGQPGGKRWRRYLTEQMQQKHFNIQAWTLFLAEMA